jgi:hypothetical protein
MPNTSTGRSVLRWLEHSSVARISVALAAVLGFAISTATGLWTLWDEVEKRRAAATVTVGTMTLGPRSRTFEAPHLSEQDPIDPAAKGGGYFSIRPDLMDIAFYDAMILFANPRKDTVTFLDCRLVLRFLSDQSDRWWWSSATADSTRDFKGILSQTPLTFVIPAGEAKAVRLRFVYLLGKPGDPFREVWRANEGRPREFFVRCFDARGGVTESAHEEAAIGGRELHFRRY